VNGYSFLAHFLDPFQLLDPVLWLIADGGEAVPVSLQQLADRRETIVTYDAPRLIAALRNARVQPPVLVDIRDGLKLLSGLSKDQGGEREWNAFSALSRASASDQPNLVGDLVAAKIPQIERAGVDALIKATVEALRTTWTDLRAALQIKGEWRRFSEIEMPVQQVFRRREFLGLPIDRKQWSDTLERVRSEKYTAYRELAQQMGFSPTSLNFWNVSKYLKGTDAEYLVDISDNQSLEHYFDLAQHQSKFAKAFLTFSDARRDESTLIRIGLQDDRAYPSFECFGTVTGRIIVTNPPLQTLKKHHRSMVVPEPGKELLYFDYCQFEPGILASLAGDQLFLLLYNTEDVYESLAMAIFNDARRRSDAKRVFLGYMYGMSVAGLSRMLAGPMADESNVAQYRSSINGFFDRFPALWEYRRTAQSDLQQSGYVSSILGNRRNRLSSGRLAVKEQQWALSQRIQGTASLIFKDALIQISKLIGSENVFLPMHDAILIQCTELEADFQRKEISKLMKDTFVRWCPGVRPQVSVGAYASE
jgi:DNA polymerase-1